MKTIFLWVRVRRHAWNSWWLYYMLSVCLFVCLSVCLSVDMGVGVSVCEGVCGGGGGWQANGATDMNKQSNRQITEENSSGTILKHVKSVESVLCDKHKFSSYVSN